MRLRDPNSAPKPVDRVPFVYVDIGDPKALSSKKTEDPQYVIQHNIPIDVLYYLEHQLRSPLKTIFDILLGEEKCDALFNNRSSFIKAKKREKDQILFKKKENEKVVAEQRRIKDKNRDIRIFFNNIN